MPPENRTTILFKLSTYGQRDVDHDFRHGFPASLGVPGIRRARALADLTIMTADFIANLAFIWFLPGALVLALFLRLVRGISNGTL